MWLNHLYSRLWTRCDSTISIQGYELSSEIRKDGYPPQLVPIFFLENLEEI